jgi:hypothetical protein
MTEPLRDYVIRRRHTGRCEVILHGLTNDEAAILRQVISQSNAWLNTMGVREAETELRERIN